MRGEQVRLVVVLALICAVSGGILALVNHLTEPRIREQADQALMRALASCLPGAGEFHEEPLPVAAGADGDVLKIFRGFCNGEPAGLVVNLEVRGYAGKIGLLVGVTEEGRAAGIKVLSHSETPGLGSKIVEDKFLEQPAFRAAGLDEYPALAQDGGGVEAVTGATISSRAVVRGVSRALAVAGAVRTLAETGEGGDRE